MKRRFFLATSLALTLACSAEAQIFNNPARSYSGAGVGFFSGGRSSGVGVGVAVSPYGYPGFYGNGMSMYGPPVPTYGTVPGTFGGSDYRVSNNAPFFGMGLGWFGKRSPSPRPTPNFEYNPPVQGNTGEPPLVDAPAPKEEVATAKSIIVEVRVPAEDALIFINDAPTKQNGALRIFESPTLKLGENYQYEIRAEWTADGKKISQKRVLIGKAGDRVVAEFTK